MKNSPFDDTVLADMAVLDPAKPAFSVVRKIHTECRKSLGADSITALLQCQMKQDCACYKFNVTTDMVTLAKHGTHAYTMQHQNTDRV